MSPTASAGAAPAADASTASSAPNAGQSAGPRPSLSDRIASRAQEMMRPPEKRPQDADTTEQRRLDGADDHDAEGQKPDAPDGDKVEKEKAKKTVPLEAMQRRIAEERQKADVVRKERDAALLDAKKAREAATILQQSLEELHKRYAEGVAYDARDDENLRLRMEQRGREIAAQLEKEHQERLQQQTQEFLLEQKKQQLRERYVEDIDTALSQFSLANRRDLIAEMKAEAAKGRRPSASAIAKVLHEKALAEFQRVTGASSAAVPALPSTARPPGARSPTRFPNNVKGYEAFIESMQRG